ncbi:uncharacterized protein LOC131329365 isoform X2 [Rhododendron vialii]|uniref:uncharacterized protein LOC131329365 isoform X2 n=1 Tax=Rhododendron vialii TaxID=182163 RepID=UPI00265FD2C9|nr:uncharacterized protein LOC131329365 isoform X2 [Rhododendron vialii]
MDQPTGEIAESLHLITSLQSQLESLQIRVKELESDNARLSSLVSNCCCHKAEENILARVSGSFGLVDERGSSNSNGGKSRKKKENQTVPDDKVRTGHQYSKRYVALKVMYFGQRFFGFASEAQMDPTVEVISLFLRSNHKKPEQSNGCSGEFVPEEPYGGEIDYVKILNKVLPKDIRVMGWCPAPTEFSARFSCLSREYKYFFWNRDLNVVAMENAGKKFVGEHDFRNFCKMDAANVHNYRRHITEFEIFPCNERFEGDQLWAVKIKGTAFLWHQVRCMVAVLFLIGQGLESPNVVDALLDVDRTPRKPQYRIAPEIPLVLQSCKFEGLRFMCSSDARQALHAHLEMECRSYKLQSAIFHEALLSCSLVENDDSVLTGKTRKKAASHVPLMSRPTEPSYEERCIKLNSRAEE